MRLAYALFEFLLVANLAAGLVRVLRGPRLADRLLAALLFGTTGVALLLTLAAAHDAPALRNVALVFMLLALLAVVAFVRSGKAPDGRADDERA
jgi:multicomponent Na+:H+ antiporter subunit F